MPRVLQGFRRLGVSGERFVDVAITHISPFKKKTSGKLTKQ